MRHSESLFRAREVLFAPLALNACIPIKSVSISSNSPFLLHYFRLGLYLQELGNVEDCREDDHGDDVVHHPPPRIVALFSSAREFSYFVVKFIKEFAFFLQI